MSITRVALVAGPAKIVRGAYTILTRESFAVNINKPQSSVSVDAYGEIDSLDEDAIVSLSFVPDGRWTADSRALLFPYANPTIGSDPFTSADVPTVITDINSHVHTIKASAVTAMPSLRLSSQGTMITGNCEITGVRGTGLAWTEADSLYKIATSGGTYADAGFNASDVLIQQWTAAWGTILASIPTQDGWTIDFPMSVGYHKAEDTGTVKGSILSVGAVAKCTPVGLSTSALTDAMLIQSTGAVRGKSARGLATDLVITGAVSGSVTLKNAKLITAGQRFGATVIRDGEIGFVAARNVTSGTGGALFAFT
jgi:hypothetical protein